MKKVGKKTIERYLGLCLSKAIRSCSPNPTTIFSGCPEVAQLSALVLDRLGYTYHVIRGRAQTPDQGWVHHFWIEIPELDLKIETNPSQIFGMPIFALVMDLDSVPYIYKAEADYPELLERMTPTGQKFYSKLADQVAACVTSYEKGSGESKERKSHGR